MENPQVNCSTISPVFCTPNICVAPEEENSPLMPPPLGFCTNIKIINKAENKTISEINKVNMINYLFLKTILKFELQSNGFFRV